MRPRSSGPVDDDPPGHDPDQARATVARIWDPRWRERLGELTLPTLVVHGREDPFFPVGNAEALAAAIPGARLLVLDDMGTALRNTSASGVSAAMLAL